MSYFQRKFKSVLKIKKIWYVKESDLFFLFLFFNVKERIRFLLKSIKSILCKVKKRRSDFIKKNKIYYTCIILKKKNFNLNSIPSFKFQTLQFCNKENFF